MISLRSLLTFKLALLLSSAAFAVPLKIAIKGINKMQGSLSVQVVDSAMAYDGKEPAVAREKLKPSNKDHDFSFDLPAGRYAVMVLHDENDNGKLDSNVIGIPTEGYGFSNNPRVMRKPTFDETVFDLGADGSAIQIDIN